MTDEAVMRTIALGLTDRRFLRTLRTRRARGSSLTVQSGISSTLDPERLALFAGFIAMVRYNNDLFTQLPGTMRVLRHYGVELATFRDHFLTQPTRSRSPAEKVRAAIVTFRALADSPRGRWLVGLRDVLLHEQCCWEITQDLATRAHAAGPGSAVFDPRGVPHLLGPARVIRIRRDPQAVLTALTDGTDLRRVPSRSRWLLYFGDAPTRTLRTLHATALAADVIHRVTGRATCAAIFADLQRVGRPAARSFRAVLDGLAEADVLRYAPRRRA